MINNLNFDINIFVFFMFIGILIKLFFGTDTTLDGSSGPATAAIWGYGVTTASIIGIMFVSFAMTQRMEKISNNSLEFVKSLFIHSVVPLLTLGILVWLISINAQFYKKINKGAVASDYYTYSGVSTFLLIIQMGMLYRYITDELKIGRETTIKANLHEILTSKMVSVTYLLTIGNSILLGIMTIILHFFSTDG
jgi:hypothetical protein